MLSQLGADSLIKGRIYADISASGRVGSETKIVARFAPLILITWSSATGSEGTRSFTNLLKHRNFRGLSKNMDDKSCLLRSWK
ncbi:unnamed protein product [Arctia plantaginis]|uniref:Uncharacterized protein n=1 Tax=Arctia plantaginis TaxID=874455 RepID=A0A8S1BQZ2_ARCPL|nr:unnamed protein product [Arctia plantaginis]